MKKLQNVSLVILFAVAIFVITTCRKRSSTVASDLHTTGSTSDVCQTYSVEAMRACVRSSKSPDDFIPKLGDRCQILTFIRNSQSPQKDEIDEKHPGVVCAVNENLTLRLTTKLNGKNWSEVEMLMRTPSAELVPVRASFASGRSELLINPLSTSGGRCTQCHGIAPKLIWSMYQGPTQMSWPEIYGAKDDEVTGNNSRVFNSFLKEFRGDKNARFQPANAALKYLEDEYEAESAPYLDGKYGSKYRSSFGYELRPNLRLNMHAVQVGGQTLARQFTSSPLFGLIPLTTLLLSTPNCLSADTETIDKKLNSLARVLKMSEAVGATPFRFSSLLFELHGVNDDPFFTFEKSKTFGLSTNQDYDQGLAFLAADSRASYWLRFTSGSPFWDQAVRVNHILTTALLNDIRIKGALGTDFPREDTEYPIWDDYGSTVETVTSAGYDRLCSLLKPKVDAELDQFVSLLNSRSDLQSRSSLHAYVLKAKQSESLSNTTQACGSCHGLETTSQYALNSDNSWWYQHALERLSDGEMPPADHSARNVFTKTDPQTLAAVVGEIKAVIANAKKVAQPSTAKSRAKSELAPQTALNFDEILKLAASGSCTYEQAALKSNPTFNFVSERYVKDTYEKPTIPAEYKYGQCKLQFCSARISCNASKVYVNAICDALAQNVCPGAGECLNQFANGLRVGRFTAGKSGPGFEKYLPTKNSELLKVYPSEAYLKQCHKNSEVMPVACVTTNLQYLERGKTTKPVADFLRYTQDELCLTAEPYSLSRQNRGSVANQCPNLEACRGARRVDDIRSNPATLQP